MAATFPDTVRQAAASRWCVRPWCTTCANHDFRRAIELLDDGTGEPLSRELSSMRLADYITIPDWDDALRVAFLGLRWPGQRERVLDVWLAQSEAPIRFLDVVLYHIVPQVGDSALRRRWIAACVERAISTHDGSLIESLLWILGAEVASQPRLFELALEVAQSYPPIRKPLLKSHVCPSPINA